MLEPYNHASVPSRSSLRLSGELDHAIERAEVQAEGWEQLVARFDAQRAARRCGLPGCRCQCPTRGRQAVLQTQGQHRAPRVEEAHSDGSAADARGVG